MGVRARIGARVGAGWGAMAPVLLSAGACPGFYVYTAYTNRYSIYLPRTPLTATGVRFTAYSNRYAIYLLRLPLTPYLLRCAANAGGMRLSLTSYCRSAYYYLLRKNGYVYPLL